MTYQAVMPLAKMATNPLLQAVHNFQIMQPTDRTLHVL
jgi:hypothetical protein